LIIKEKAMSDELKAMKKRRKSLSGASDLDNMIGKLERGVGHEVGGMTASALAGMLKVPGLRGSKVKIPWNKRKKKNGPS
jgi:hypothetical protein